jgi:isoprenylcysteine carboxyl methyltransferase (ICMT) family protein YpbQ
MMTTKTMFVGIVAAIILQRLSELRISQRNVAYLLAQGGREHDSNYLWMVKALQISWFVAMIAEVYWLDRPFVPALAVVGLLAAIAGQCLRYLSMQALGVRWTLPIITLPGAPVVDSGIYRYLRHPNWLGVILEIVGVPLIHTAYFTAIFFTLANALLMIKRIHKEEQVLGKDNEEDRSTKAEGRRFRTLREANATDGDSTPPYRVLNLRSVGVLNPCSLRHGLLCMSQNSLLPSASCPLPFPDNYAAVFADRPRFIPSSQLLNGRRVKVAIQIKLFTLAKAITTSIVPAPIAMYQMICGFWVSRAIYIAAKLGIADYLQNQPKTAEELAALTDTHAPSLYRLLRALTSVGVFVEDNNHRFGLTPLAATLQSQARYSLRFMAIAELGSEHYLGWGNLMHSIKTGETAFNHAAGMSIWDYYSQHPEDSKSFNRAMTDVTATVIEAVLESYDFSSFNTVVDVGGGRGHLIAAILKTNSTLKGILLDLPAVIEDAPAQLVANGVAERCVLVAGSFFESIPVGGDAYLLKWIVHDWDDAQAIAILKNCHQAMPDNSKLLLIEQVISPKNGLSFAQLMDLNMLVTMGGRERTAAEYRSLLQATGFQLTRIIPTLSPVSVIEAIKT